MAIPATSASSTSRTARSNPDRSPGASPDLSFTVTGRPEPSPAARASRKASSGRCNSAAPAPAARTLRTGQPMLMSIRSAPASAAIAAAERITSGSWPNSWIETGCSAGWMRKSSRMVRSLRWWSPKLETISETARPAPCRRAWRRTNQLPIPARGASSTRFETVTSPMRNGVVSGGRVNCSSPRSGAGRAASAGRRPRRSSRRRE